MALGGTFGAKVIIDPVKLQKALNDAPNGLVYRAMFSAGDAVVGEAKKLVGYGKPDPLGRPRRYPNHLRDTIVKRIVSEGGRPVVYVGSNHPIALWHHEGTVPHVIVPVRKPRLVFYSYRAGRVVYAKRVNHPGTRPNRYLTNALRVLRRRF